MLCGVWRTLELLWRGGFVTLLCDATTNFVATSTVPIDVTFSYWILSYCTSFPPIVSCVALEVCVRLSYWDKFYHNSINPVPGGCNRDRTVLYKNWSFVHNIGGWSVLQGFIIKVYWVDSMMQNIAVRSMLIWNCNAIGSPLHHHTMSRGRFSTTNQMKYFSPLHLCGLTFWQ